MDNKLSVSIENKLYCLKKLKEEFNEFGTYHKFRKKAFLDIHLALDEILTNIINYGYNDNKVHLIEVKLQLQDNILKLEIIDDSRPFNMLEMEDPNTDQSLKNRPIGGLGIYLVKNLMNNLKYLRKNEKNHLTMEKQVLK